jgi:hypothetical protein
MVQSGEFRKCTFTCVFQWWKDDAAPSPTKLGDPHIYLTIKTVVSSQNFATHFHQGGYKKEKELLHRLSNQNDQPDGWFK